MAFVFENYRFDQDTLILECVYSDRGYEFVERVDFSALEVSSVVFSQENFIEVLDKACQGYFLMAGISYFKAFVSSEVRFSSEVSQKIYWTEDKKNFFEKVYYHGLGEFFCENEIDPVGKINFPKTFSVEESIVSVHFGQAQGLPLQGALLPLGGGKDSLTSAHLLKKFDKNFVTWTVDSDAKFERQAELLGTPHCKVARKISHKLIELNKSGEAFNGHIPISAIWAFLSVISALLLGKQYVVLSNEHSANEATLEYLGMDVNHQYSKSLAFEEDFQQFVGENISAEISYFSLLRPLREIHIAQIFCEEGVWEKFVGNFSSCNRNFHIDKKLQRENFFWCGECAKCAFVACIFAPYLVSEKLWGLFGGKNLFRDLALRETFLGLLGFDGDKPFECVGEIAEVRWSLWSVREKYPEVLRFFPDNFSDKDLENFDPRQKFTHKIPDEFRDILESV